MKIEANTKLLFIGDSITDADRSREHNGEGLFNEPYGDGYVRNIKSLLDAAAPQRRIRVINQGVAGNTIKDLEARWEQDVLDHEPDWLGVMIGINDVWRQFDQPLVTEQHIGLDQYADTYCALLEPIRSNIKGLVIASPYVIDNQKSDAMRMRMDQYGSVAKEIAAEFDAFFVDVQAAFDEHLDYYHANQLAWDRIHPNATGHMIIARAWLDAVDYKWSGE